MVHGASIRKAPRRDLLRPVDREDFAGQPRTLPPLAVDPLTTGVSHSAMAALVAAIRAYPRKAEGLVDSDDDPA